MKKCDHLREYMIEYKKNVFNNPDLCTDKYNRNQLYVDFQDNRHEQSITSILRKKMGSEVVESDETWTIPFGKGDSIKYPFWATRIRDK